MRLVFGRAGTGKNRFVFDDILNTVSEENQILLIVPEQTLFFIERRLFLHLGHMLFKYVCVRSFSRLADEILRTTGNASKERLCEAAKIALIRRAVYSLEDELTYYRKSRADTGFFRLVSEVIDECRDAYVSPKMLRELSKNAATGITKRKLNELALILERYESLLLEKYDDENTFISAASSFLKESGLSAGKAVYIDGFTGFTEPEHELISAVARDAKDVTVTLLCDENSYPDASLFYNVRQSALRLKKVFKDLNISIEHIELTDRSMTGRGILTLESFLMGESDETGDTTGVYISSPKDTYEELTRVASEITDLTRNRGYRYSDIAVISRDIESYRPILMRIFKLYDIPYFADWTENESYSSAAVFVRTALEVLEVCSYENMLGLLKTSLTSVSGSDIAAFENYIYVWGLEGSTVNTPFINNPDGFSKNPDEQARNRLLQAENTRIKITGWVCSFCEKAKREEYASGIIKEIYSMMLECGAADTLLLRNEMETTVSLFEKLYHILDKEVMEVSEIGGVAEVLFQETFSGRVPAMIEQVQVGAADRIRTNHPRAVFVIGLNEGMFPRTNFELPLLSLSERDYICDSGIVLRRNFDSLLAMEELYLYNALTCAIDLVYLSMPKEKVSGEVLEPSIKIKDFIKNYKVAPAPTENERFSAIVNKATAKVAYLTDPAVRKLIVESGEFDFSEEIDSLFGEPLYMLKDSDLLNSVTGESMNLSPSRIDTFMNCRFRYFLQYMLGVYPIEQAKISPVQAGSFIHYILEYVFRNAKGGLGSATPDILDSLCEEAADSYIRSTLGDTALSSHKTGYQLERLKEQAKRLTAHLKSELAQSAFMPVDFELEIKENGDVEPRILMLTDGTRVKVTGKIDRVDIADIDGSRYVRVIDYKTGTMKFSLDDVFGGINIQMLVYLFSLTENAVSRYGNIIPAGALYMPSDPLIPSYEAGIDKIKDAYRMDGVVLSDPEIIKAMDGSTDGIFIPVKIEGDSVKGFSDKLASLEEMERIKKHIDGIIAEMATQLKNGNIEALPAVRGNTSACEYCDYLLVCKRDRFEHVRIVHRGAHLELKGEDNG